MLCNAMTGFSMEGITKRELSQLGVENIKCNIGSVSFEGGWADIYRANLMLRTADRVTVVLGQCEIVRFADLYDWVRSLDWKTFIPKHGRITVNGKCARSKLMSIRDCQRIIKKSIVDALCAAYRTNVWDETSEEYPVIFSIHGDQCTLMLDTSGNGLNRRGYRTWNGEAPLKETLAAAMVMLSPWYRTRDRGAVLYDPCCGTGTILIEAALIATDTAPGLMRTFAMDAWHTLTDRQREDMHLQAKARIHRDALPKICGSDIDAEAIRLSLLHISRASMQSVVEVRQSDLREVCLPQDETVCFVTNPPYGERMGDTAACKAIYKALYQLKNRHPHARMSALSSHPAFEKFYGERAAQRYRFYNGVLECVDYIY